MGLLSERDIDLMRATLEESLPETAVIQRRGFVDDGAGGGTTSWNASGTMDARVALISATETDIAERLAEDADWMITVPASASITTDDRVVIGSRTFNVLALHAPRSFELSRRVEANEVT
jgi:head-tail adaptor